MTDKTDKTKKDSKAPKGQSWKSATGAQMFASDTAPKGRSVSTLRAAQSKALDEVTSIGSAKFKEKYGMSWTKYDARIDAAIEALYAKNSRNIKGGKSSSVAELHDRFEKEASSKGYNKGGLVKKYVNAGASVAAHKGKRK